MSTAGKVFFYKCDITSSASVKEVADQIKKELGTTTILCNNAGIGRTNLITEASDSHLDKIFKINLISHWYTVREFLPDMIEAKKGHIISTASMASYTTCAGMVDYCVTKAGAQAFTDGIFNPRSFDRLDAKPLQVSTRSSSGDTRHHSSRSPRKMCIQDFIRFRCGCEKKGRLRECGEYYCDFTKDMAKVKIEFCDSK